MHYVAIHYSSVAALTV